jgi:hypothetical protein
MNPDIEGSFTRVNYLLRPAKQVERKLLLQALHFLSRAGYVISDYCYAGFGSIYYADFQLFHKYLYIKNMVCMENRAIPGRMAMNKPFDFISLRMEEASEYLAQVDQSIPHFLWLDYDDSLDEEKLAAIASAATTLALGSIILTTVSTRIHSIDRASNVEAEILRREEVASTFNATFGHLLPHKVEPKHLAKARIPALFTNVLSSLLEQQVGLRSDGPVAFMQLFNFLYADGAPMLSYGGIIDTPERLGELKARGIQDLRFISTDSAPRRIFVPYVTTREKAWLDQNLHACAQPDPSLPFELTAEELSNYLTYYKEYPVYSESLL